MQYKRPLYNLIIKRLKESHIFIFQLMISLSLLIYGLNSNGILTDYNIKQKEFIFVIDEIQKIIYSRLPTSAF